MIFQNGDFSSGLAGWLKNKDTTLALDNGDFAGTAPSAIVTHSATITGWSGAYRKCDFASGEEYEWGAFIKGPVGLQFYVQINFFTPGIGAGLKIVLSPYTVFGGGWQEIKGSFVVPSGVAQDPTWGKGDIGFYWRDDGSYYAQSLGQSFRLDGVFLRKITTGKTLYQPTLPSEETYTEAEKNFIDESPPGLFPENQNSNFGFLIRKVFCDEIQNAADQLDRLYREEFVTTAQDFLDDWEYEVGLPINPSGVTLTQRRANILSRLQKSAFTRERRKAIVGQFVQATIGDAPRLSPSGIVIGSGGVPLYGDVASSVGLYRLYDSPTTFSYVVVISNAITVDLVGLTRELTRFTPAGISFTIDTSTASALRYWALPTSDGAIGYWALANVNDSSGNGNGMTAYGGVTAGSGGWIAGNSDGSATHFDGVNDYMANLAAVPLYDTIHAANQFTVEAWVKPSVLPASGKYPLIAGLGNAMIRLNAPEEGHKFASTFAGYANLESTTVAVAATAYHVVTTYDGRYHKIYINSVLENTIDRSVAVPSGSNVFYIGSYNDGNFFNGDIDEVALYNYALSAEQIAEHFNIANNTPTW